MKTLMMSKFGRTLTDRILKEESFPLMLDFESVMALGSSFGDEVIAAIASKQDRIVVTNTNGAVRSCLDKIATDLKIQIEFGS